VQNARAGAERFGVLATVGKVLIEPNGVNAIPSGVTGWLDARGAEPDRVQGFVEAFEDQLNGHGGRLTGESWTEETPFDPALAQRLARLLGDAPVLATGAGHDAGILANAGVPTAMLFVRNPTGISHSPAEYAERDDCVQGVLALATAVADLAR
jgi:N-carbamoyl-L-amino-acid hydrolase